MRTVLLPIKDGRITQGFKTGHSGYDIAPKVAGDTNTDLRYALSGVIMEAVGTYTKSWKNGAHPDPTPAALTTEDYGNYIKVKNDDGEIDFYAHLQPFNVGNYLNKRVSQGSANGIKIGTTGNSTGIHTHYEHRNAQNQRVTVEFINEIEGSPPMDNEIIKRADAFVAVCDVLKKPVDKDVVIEDIKRLIELERILVEREKSLDIKSGEIKALGEKLTTLTEEKDILTKANGVMQGQIETQEKRLTLLTRELNDMANKIEGLEKIQPIPTNGWELILRGIARLLGR